MEHLKKRLNINAPNAFEVFREDRGAQGGQVTVKGSDQLDSKLQMSLSLLTEPHSSETIRLLADILRVEQFDFKKNSDKFKMAGENSDTWFLKK
jgi:hypothetical protein